MHIHFVSAAGGSVFMHELLEVVAHAVVNEAGGSASLHIGKYPEDDGSSIYVVIPHEYFVLTSASDHPSPSQMQRTIAFCVEHPGNATFNTSALWAAQLGAAVDISRDSLRMLRAQGIGVEHFRLGYSPLWDVWHGDDAVPRAVDLTYLGTTDPRRDRLIASQARGLSEWRTALFIPPHEQQVGPRPGFLVGKAKYAHLANSRILFNLHRGASTALELVRVLEAMCNGCVVVSETSTDIEPFLPGRHIAFARPSTVVAVATAILRHPDRLEAMRREAYDFCRSGLPMRDPASLLLDIGQSLLKHGPVRGGRPSRRDLVPATPFMPESAQPDPETPRLSSASRTLPAQTREALATVVAHSLCRSDITVARQSPRPAPGSQRIDVLIAENGDRAALGVTLRSLKTQHVPTQVFVGSSSPMTPAIGYPRSRLHNTLSAESSSDEVLIVDPGVELLSGALDKLVKALADDPDAAVVYPMVADPSSGRVWNVLPVEVERLRRRVYLKAPMLIRRAALMGIGGYSEDPMIGGFEDHELWLRLLNHGYSGTLVPQILAIGPWPVGAPLGIPSLLPDEAWAAIASSGRPVAVGPH